MLQDVVHQEHVAVRVLVTQNAAIILIQVWLDRFTQTVSMEWHFPGAQQCWAHSCCSQNALKAAFKNSQITAIEADILMGISGGSNSEIPIMAHPPTKTSDLSFQEFWQQCVEEARHHLKLDFKERKKWNVGPVRPVNTTNHFVNVCVFLAFLICMMKYLLVC